MVRRRRRRHCRACGAQSGFPAARSTRTLGFLKTLTKAWFGFADVLAWLLVFVCVLGAVASPFAIPAYLQSRGESISTLALVAIASAYMLTALGAYLFTWAA